MGWKHNAFYGFRADVVTWWNLWDPGAFSMGTIHFGQIYFLISQLQKFTSLSWHSLRRYGHFVTTESSPRLVFTKPGKPPQKCLLRSESFALPTKANRCTELKRYFCALMWWYCLTLVELHMFSCSVQQNFHTSFLSVLSFTPLVVYNE